MSKSVEEVRYACLRPAAVVARRKALPLAWLPKFLERAIAVFDAVR